MLKKIKSSHFSILLLLELVIVTQYTENLFQKQNLKIQWEKFDIFNIHVFAQNIDCGYTLEPPRLGGSNEYPQSMFWNNNKNNRVTVNPSFTI